MSPAIPETNVAIELGGEDAKIIYFDNGIEQRMNGVCAGGTGSFIDQMATLLQTDAGGLNELAKNYSVIYLYHDYFIHAPYGMYGDRSSCRCGA